MTMADPLMHNIACREILNDADREALMVAFGCTTSVPAGSHIAGARTAPDGCTLLISGWAGRMKHLCDGRRQIVMLSIPGDFLDVADFALRRSDSDPVAPAPCRIARVTYERLQQLIAERPRIARLFLVIASMDAAIVSEHVLSLGRRDALQRMAHLLCELDARKAMSRSLEIDGFYLPLTQTELADCIGITPVHANRVLQELRARKLITLRMRQLTILDREALAALAEFDPRYLEMPVSGLSPGRGRSRVQPINKASEPLRSGSPPPQSRVALNRMTQAM